jgi:hypothetical protein
MKINIFNIILIVQVYTINKNQININKKIYKVNIINIIKHKIIIFIQIKESIGKLQIF